MAEPAIPPTVLIAHVADRRFAMDATDVIAVRDVPAATRLPQSPPHLLGVFQHEGRIVPLVDLPRMLQTATRPDRPRVVVVQSRGLAMGLIVDTVQEILPLAGATIETPRGEHLEAELEALVLGRLVVRETEHDPQHLDAGDGDAASTASPASGLGVTAVQMQVDAVLREAPDWLRRIHQHDDAQRRRDDIRRAHEVLGGGRPILLLDLQRVWYRCAEPARGDPHRQEVAR